MIRLGGLWWRRFFGWLGWGEIGERDVIVLYDEADDKEKSRDQEDVSKHTVRRKKEGVWSSTGREEKGNGRFYLGLGF